MTRACRSLAIAVALAGAASWPARARAETIINGGSVGGQVWTAAGSPIRVTGVIGSLTVPAGEELRIEAGTLVSFSDGYGRVSLTVDGTLTINGTAAAPVVLQGETSTSMWSGISLASANAVIRITGATIGDANKNKGCKCDAGDYPPAAPGVLVLAVAIGISRRRSPTRSRRAPPSC